MIVESDRKNGFEGKSRWLRIVNQGESGVFCEKLPSWFCLGKLHGDLKDSAESEIFKFLDCEL